MAPPKQDLDRQLERQAAWLRESYLWILNRSVLAGMPDGAARPTALDVGCGPGHVMDILRTSLDAKGIDCDPDMVAASKARTLDTRIAYAEELPYRDDSFDLVYCSFLLLWVKDPSKVVREMRRVARKWVICLAEPDFGGRLDYPEELSGLRSLISDGIIEQGGDPNIGRKLRSHFSACGIASEVGVHQGIWGIDRLAAESEDEWKWLEMSVKASAREKGLEGIKQAWRKALIAGSLFQYNPIFYAIGRK